MKFISRVFALIISLCYIANASSHSPECDPEITRALEKFYVEYQTLRESFSKSLRQSPLEDPIHCNSKIMEFSIFYSSMYLIHIRDEDYWNSFHTGKVSIKHILGLANVLAAWQTKSAEGFTEQNVYFLSQVLKYHQATRKESKFSLDYLQP